MKSLPYPIPLCVPRWDERAALDAGAKYCPERGFHITEDQDPDLFWNWLPLRWKHPERATLLPEMLPATTWEENLRTALAPHKWDAVRKHCYAAAGYRCEICGDRGNPHLEAHERWDFDDTWCVQRLAGLIALCPPCHKAHHLGLAKRIGLFDAAFEKMKEVNGWSDRQTHEAIFKARALANERSRFAWHVDLSWLDEEGYHLVVALA